MEKINILEEIATILDNKKSEDIEIINIEKISTLSDYLIICSGKNFVHTKSLADSVKDELSKNYKIFPHKVEGYNSANWIVIDYYDVVVHIFEKQTRGFYNLGEIWNDGKKIHLDNIIKNRG